MDIYGETGAKLEASVKKYILGSINRNKPSKYPIDTDICHLCCDLLQIFSRKVGLLLSSVRFPQG